MLNQEKIGKFIAEQRKSKNMTQRQMAEQLGVSDKAVSKWETGKSMPDNSLLMELCELLKINVNELLSGEKLSEDNYQGKAEENMTNLMEEREYEKKSRKKLVLEAVIGGVGFVIALFLTIFISAGSMGWYIDFPSLFMIISVMVFVVFVSGYGFDFFRAFAICFRKNVVDAKEVRRSMYACNLVLITIAVTGAVVTLIGVISSLHQSAEGIQLAANIGVALIAMLYACVLDLIILPFTARLWFMANGK